MRKATFAFILSLLVIGVPALVWAGSIDSDLQSKLTVTPTNQTISALVYLTQQVDLDAITDRMDSRNVTLQERHETVVRSLQDAASSSQSSIINYLEDLKSAGQIKSFEAFWLANCIRVDAPVSKIEEIAQRSDVFKVYYNYEIETITPVGEVKPGGTITVVENGVQAVNAPQVWAMGFHGEGVLVATIDTGVDGNHPALASRWAGVADPRYAGHPEWAWYDPYGGQNNFPYDPGGHGTHTMGTVCGGAPGDEIGVAPGAHWMAAGPIDRASIPQTVADAILSFQWMVDPDGNPSTNWDVPAVCSNSWGLVTAHGYPPCDQTFWTYLDACEAAGTVILFSAGNESTSGLRRPADRATDDYRTCAVAAVDAHQSGWPLAYFSSQGPTYCTPDGSAAIKPDIAAPGVDVRSSYPGGGYITMSGTSMASPHVNGVVALIRQANPNLSVNMVKQIIYDTAFDLGSPGQDNQYGWGMIDAYAAVQLALSYLSGYGAIQGRVTDAVNGSGLPGTVTVTNHVPPISTVCNAQGYYTMYVPADTAWYLKAEYTSDYQPAYAWVTVLENDTAVQNFALQPPVLGINMIPNNPPIYIHAGESFSYSGVLMNNTNGSGLADVWVMVDVPNYGMYGPLQLYPNVPLGPYDTLIVNNIVQNVPNFAPVGLYHYIAYCGDYPNVVIAQTQFNFIVLPTGGQLAQVAILCADYTNDWNEARDLLLADPNVLGVDFIDVMSSTPALQDLLTYNVVLVWSNYQFADATSLGNVLADFADIGGAVVTAEFSHYDGWALSGRYMTDYSPAGVGNSGYVNANLVVDDPNHPIMLGVNTGGEYYDYDYPLQGNTQLLSHWDNGRNGTVVNADAPRCVAINDYFGQSYRQWTGDIGQMMVNAVVFAANNSFSAAFPPPKGFFDQYAAPKAAPVQMTKVANNSKPATEVLAQAGKGSLPTIPTEYSLTDAYPNPFNASAKIGFALPENANVRLEVFNMMGQKVTTLVDKPMEAGSHSIIWDASNNSSGIYFYRLTTEKFTSTKRVSLVK